MAGRLDDPDHVRVHVEGEPQLWQVEARGPDTVCSGSAQTAPRRVSARSRRHGERSVVTDAYLIPGDHWFRVDGTGEYALTPESLGPPVPGGEREPNDALAFAKALPMDGSVTGRIGSDADGDVFRFSLAATEHLKLTLDPPPDATFQVYPFGDAAPLLSFRRSASPGAPVEMDVVLPAGDHAFEVLGPVDEERYRLSLQRLDPFELAADQEPNNEAATAGRCRRAFVSREPPRWATTPIGIGSTRCRQPASSAFVTEGRSTPSSSTMAPIQTPLVAEPDGLTFRSPPLPAGASVAWGSSPRPVRHRGRTWYHGTASRPRRG